MQLLPANSIFTNVFVTIAVVLFVVLMPAIDLKLCAWLGISPYLGPGTRAAAAPLLRFRKCVLYAGFALYVGIVAYMVFFSREAANDYLVHVAPFQDLADAVQIDLGALGVAQEALSGDVPGTYPHISISSFDTVAQVYLNVMLFVPLGYLLPYLFRWFRNHMRVRVTAASFLCSLCIENVQLVSKRGFYDVDDLVTNTLGGFIGALLFIMFAYVVMNPHWKRDARAYRRWLRKARKRALYPFAHTVDLSRTTLLGTNEDDIWDFYVEKLGFRCVGRVVPLDSDDTTFLFQMGRSQVEIRCSNQEQDLSEQYLNVSAQNLPRIRRRLVKAGLKVGQIEDDAFPGTRKLSLRGPDNVCITIFESYVG